MNAIRCVLLLSMLSVATGCGYINTRSYAQYIDDHKGEFQFPNTGYEAQYYIAPQVRNFRKVVLQEPGTPDYYWASSFIYVFGPTLESDDYRAAFNSLSETTEETLDEGLLFKYEKVHYEFTSRRARISLRTVVTLDGQVILARTFQQKGPSQTLRLLFLGRLENNYASYVSTKSALDRLLADSLLSLQLEMDTKTGAE